MSAARGHRRLLARPAIRLGLPTVVALVLGLAATAVGAWFIHTNERRSAERILQNDSAQFVALIDQTFQRIEAVLGAASAAVQATDGNRQAFEGVVEGRTDVLLKSLALIRFDGQAPTVLALEGAQPALLSSLNSSQRAVLESVSPDEGVRLVGITTIGALRVIGLAAGARPGEAAYAELWLPNFLAFDAASAPDMTYAVYRGESEASDEVLSTTATTLPIEGLRVTQTLTLGAETVFVVVGSEGAVVGGLTAWGDALTLVLGVLATLIIAALLEMRRRRAEALAAQWALTLENDLLRDVDQMKDDFLAVVSHDLRTPLTSILGYTELLREGGQLTGDQQELIEVVDRNARRLIELVGQLLLLAQLEGGGLPLDVGPVPVVQLLRECLANERPRAEEKGIELHLTRDADESIFVSGDYARLTQVFGNLLANAVKFTAENGSVEVSVSSGGESAIVEVRDTGIGVPVHELERLFDRFYRASSARTIQGTGLGLSIAKAIVDAHGGSIGVESEEGKGTTFRIELPIRPAAGMRAAPRRAVAS